MTKTERIRRATTRFTRTTSWLPLLFTRLVLGGVFVASGWGKMHDLGKVTGFFTELGIPALGFNAGLVASTELVGGALLLVGLASRLASIPLSVVMIVALATAKKAEIHGVVDFAGLSEVAYLAMLVTILCLGPGLVSIDAIVARVVRRKYREPEPEFVPAYVVSLSRQE